MNHTTVPGKLYLRVWAALMLLLLLTWGLAQFNLGLANTSAALVIAVVKMLLVIMFFMHVRYQSRLTWVFAGAGFLWLLIMISLTMTDYLTRGRVRHPDPSAIHGTVESSGHRP
jgi:cytochrome c oxidase subunit IV